MPYLHRTDGSSANYPPAVESHISAHFWFPGLGSLLLSWEATPPLPTLNRSLQHRNKHLISGTSLWIIQPPKKMDNIYTHIQKIHILTSAGFFHKAGGWRAWNNKQITSYIFSSTQMIVAVSIISCSLSLSWCTKQPELENLVRIKLRVLLKRNPPPQIISVISSNVT